MRSYSQQKFEEESDFLQNLIKAFREPLETEALEILFRLSNTAFLEFFAICTNGIVSL